jgi:hypothetical protein
MNSFSAEIRGHKISAGASNYPIGVWVDVDSHRIFIEADKDRKEPAVHHHGSPSLLDDVSCIPSTYRGLTT